MKRIFITGANRGLGLEMVRQYAQEGQTQIFATYRDLNHTHALQSLATQYAPHIELVPLDVRDETSIQALAGHLEDKTNGLDILINNAGINPSGEGQTVTGLTMDGFLDVLRVNTVAPALVVQALLPYLRKGHTPRVINISSDMGSIGNRNYGGYHAYSTSKAGLNMLSKGMAAELGGYNIIVVSIDPGWVKTDMGGTSAPLHPEESIKGLRKVIDGLTIRQNGHYFDYHGHKVPW